MNDDRLKELAYTMMYYCRYVDSRDIDPDDDNILRWWWHSEYPESPEIEKFRGVISPCINSPSCKVEVEGISQELIDLVIAGKAVPIPNPLVLQKDGDSNGIFRYDFIDTFPLRSHTRYRERGDTKIP